MKITMEITQPPVSMCLPSSSCLEGERVSRLASDVVGKLGLGQLTHRPKSDTC